MCLRSGKGTYLITTAEGAEWQLGEMPARLMSPEVGQPIEIRAGTSSGYLLRIDGQKSVTGRRVV